jgi:hypothetical protein
MSEEETYFYTQEKEKQSIKNEFEMLITLKNLFENKLKILSEIYKKDEEIKIEEIKDYRFQCCYIYRQGQINILKNNLEYIKNDLIGLLSNFNNNNKIYGLLPYEKNYKFYDQYVKVNYQFKLGI